MLILGDNIYLLLVPAKDFQLPKALVSHNRTTGNRKGREKMRMLFYEYTCKEEKRTLSLNSRPRHEGQYRT